MVVEARVRLRHRGCYSETLAKSLRVVHLSGDGTFCLTLVQGGSSDERAAVLDAMARSFGTPAQVLEAGADRTLARCHCATGGVVPKLLGAGATVIWPVLHEGGWERFHLVVPENAAMEKVLAMLAGEGEVRVDQLATTAADGFGAQVWLSSFAQVLSPRQLDALKLAIERGYYAQPRKATLDELAALAGVSRSTYQEHLAKAERAVMELVSGLLGGEP